MTAPSTEPVVSVLVPTLGRRRLLAQALASIKAQTFPHFEVLVLNDGGPSVRPVIDALDDPRFFLEEFPDNRGKAARLNLGLRRPGAQYVAYLDEDDEYLSDHLAVLVDALRARPLARWAYADTLVRYHHRASRTRAPVFTEIENEADVNFPMLYWGNRINHKNAVHERTLALEVGGYDEAAAFYIDWEIFLKMAAICPPHHVRRITSIYYRPMFATTNKTFQAHRDPGATARRVRAVRCATVPTSTDGPVVSLLVAPGDDPSALVSTVLAAVEQAAHARLEVVVPASGALDELHLTLGARGIACRSASIGGQRDPLAFNTMASVSAGDVLALVRPGHTLLPGWLRAAVPLTGQPHAGLVGSIDLDGSGTWTRHIGLGPDQDGTPCALGRGWRSTDARLCGPGTVPAVAAWTTCVTRAAFDGVGGFDPQVPDALAMLDLSLRLADQGRTHTWSPNTWACEQMPDTAGWPLPTSAALRAHGHLWQHATSWRTAALPAPLAEPSVALPPPPPYRVVDPTALGRHARHRRRVLLFGTARPAHVEAVACALRAPGLDVEVHLLAHITVAAELAAHPAFARHWEFHSHRLHLSLLPEALVSALRRERYDFAVVAMNGPSLVDFGHVFALARLAGAPPRFAVMPPFTVLAIDDHRLQRLRGAWYGRTSLDRLSDRLRRAA